MALTATQKVIDGVKSHSVGPLKVEYATFTVANGDTSGTITAQSLNSVLFAVVENLVLTAATTYSGKVATITFADPLATRHGTAILIGK